MTENNANIDLLEESLSSFFVQLKRSKRLLGTCLIIAILIATLIVIIKSITVFRISQIEYTISLDDISNNRYPNGERFNVNHIVNPSIFNLSQKDKEPSASIPTQAIQYINWAYDNLNYRLILKQYNKLLNSKDANASEVIQLQAEMSQKLKQHKLVRITIAPEIAGISDNAAKQLLLSLVETWSKHHIENGALSGAPIPQIPPEVPTLTSSKNLFTLVTNLENHFAIVDFSIRQLLVSAQQKQQFSLTTDLEFYQQLLKKLTKSYFDVIFYGTLSQTDDNALRNLLSIRNEQNVTQSIDQSIEVISAIIKETKQILLTETDGNKSQDQSEAPLPHSFDLLQAGKNLGFVDLFSSLTRQRLESMRKSNDLLFDVKTYQNNFDSLRGASINPSIEKPLHDFLTQYQHLVNDVSERIKQYRKHYLDGDRQTLYSAHQYPTKNYDLNNIFIFTAISYITAIFLSIFFWLVLVFIRNTRITLT